MQLYKYNTNSLKSHHNLETNWTLACLLFALSGMKNRRLIPQPRINQAICMEHNYTLYLINFGLKQNPETIIITTPKGY